MGQREDYAAYLQSEHWATMRRLALEWADHRCQGCNADGPRLEVHHRVYGELYQEKLSDLTVLCPRCHEAIEKARAGSSPLPKSLTRGR